MSIRNLAACFAILALGSGPLCAQETGVKTEVGASSGAVEVGSTAAAQPQNKEADTPKKACIARCEADNGRCNSEVRRGRQECSRQTANGGNNPFTGRPDTYDMYCGYFSLDHCGFAGNRGMCSQRFSRRYAECVEWMRGNVASRRFDCHRAETKASGLCRAELQDCRRQCP